MARVFITGSADGLGLMAAGLLLEQGHTVVLHARNSGRAETARKALPGAETVLLGDLSSLRETVALAEAANELGCFDAVIHNAAVGYKEPRRVLTADGLPHVFQVNTLAPYVLTAMMRKPGRLVYVSSELHRRGDPNLDDLAWKRRTWNGTRAYSDTKLHDVLLAFAFARHWPDVLSNAMEPGWVPTRMDGPNATGDLDQGHRTQTWLAVSDARDAAVTSEYFYHLRRKEPLAATREVARQDELLARCADISGVKLAGA